MSQSIHLHHAVPLMLPPGKPLRVHVMSGQC